MVFNCVLGVLIVLSATIQSDGARFACNRDADCDVTSGQKCVFEYDGCGSGECRCPPSTHKTTPSGCVPLRYGGETCTEDIQCPVGVSCQQGICACAHGHLSSDRTYCLQDYNRMLGDYCTQRDTTCLQYRSHEMGYTTSSVECTGGVCQCVSGYKTHRGSCVPYLPGERGCEKHYQCRGGARCEGGVCRCPANHSPAADGQKCARTNAKTQLGVGQSCDELSGTRYCGYGLVCHQCIGRSTSTCVKHNKPARRDPRASTSNALCTHQVAFCHYLSLASAASVVTYYAVAYRL